ncbi:thiamine phosphate synthase [Sinorhizobium alkalisoli]|uniref:Thiamine phosphate synthase n=1 Tax=Sinorhizobium alkalisoli TaxID=1752398 RepID=A0A1E3VCH5_9HYPH|nr:thiamine phosphate synthase [Sinorhizobium alkalisoli]MCA1492413.1 thiamine phosphate synthase [Ensifer sp. NBAIM29]ODR90576.1 thiamine phosphate synthase [Sinorhizobium alkalisoli]QFI67612.1 Thiamin-phosphate pyrophosphorylase [Sinorhizobium alkalisoli]
MSKIENRCRLVLVAPDIPDIAEQARVLADALKGGDVASVIVPQYGLNETDFQKHAEALVPVIQEAGAAALIDGDTRVAGRARADGIHIPGGADALSEAIERHTPKMIVGGGNATDRHHALEIGELRPDYVFFGRTDGDIKPEAHPKNLALAEWWASMIEIPCVVMGGADPQSALAVAETGAEFVALRLAVFADPAQAPSVVAAVNALLDEKAPRFED